MACRLDDAKVAEFFGPCFERTDGGLSSRLNIADLSLDKEMLQDVIRRKL